MKSCLSSLMKLLKSCSMKYVTVIVSLAQYGSGVLWWVWRASQPCLYGHVSVCLHAYLRNHTSKLHLITRRRSWSFTEYCKHFVARLNDVHAFGYNSAGSERIWMKFGELQVYCLELSPTNFGRDPRRSGSGSASRNFFLSIKQLAISPTSGRPNFTKFAQKDVFPSALWGFWKTFVKICP